MPRTLTVQLMIAAVLVCPFGCLSERPEDGSVAIASEKPCCCESAGDPHQEDGSPRPSSAPDCLCRGAILIGVKIEPTEYSVELFSNPLCHLDASCPIPANCCLAAAAPQARHFPPFSIGRDVCALKCALLL